MIEEEQQGNKITRIEVDQGDVTFYLEGSDEPWSADEFDKYTETGLTLRVIEDLILDLGRVCDDQTQVRSY